MRQSIIHIALLVRDYDEALAFSTEKFGFTRIEDTHQLPAASACSNMR